MVKQRATIIAAITLLTLGLVVIFISFFIWYAKTVIPHTYPTVYTNFWWGFIHALFIIPTFIWSLFAHTITIYQSPNSGAWYNFGFLLGISILFGGSHSARQNNKSKRPKYPA